LPLAHFEEAIDDEDEFREIGGKSTAKDIFLPFQWTFLLRLLPWNIFFRILLFRIVKLLY
jgi:hypothetical protein